MKKTIATIALLTMVSASSAFASQDYLEVKNIKDVNGDSLVTYERGYNDGKENRILMTFGMNYFGKVTPSQAVEKGAMLADEVIFVKASGVTPVQGQVNKLAGKRSEAWTKGGFNGYMAELTRQITALGAKW